MKKRILAVLLMVSVLTVTMLSGCGQTKTSSSSSGSSQYGPVLQKIYDRGYVIMGNDSTYAPFGFKNLNNEATGVDIAVGTKLAEKLTEKLGKNITLKVESMDFQTVLSSLTAGNIDVVISCCTITEERKKTMDFSSPYLDTTDTFLIRKADKDKYTNNESFNGKSIAANIGSSQEIKAQKMAAENGCTYTGMSTTPDAILALKAGKVEGIIVDNIVAKRFVVNDDSLMLVEKSSFASADKGLAVQQGNQDFLDIINEEISDLKANNQVNSWVDEYSKLAAELLN